MSPSTTGRGVLVTGASRGIGAATALAFARLGDRVAVHSGSARDRAEAVVAGLPGEGHVVVGADLADPEAVERMVAAAVEGLGGVDVLVNNAAVFTDHPIATIDPAGWRAAWRETVAINLLGTADVSYHVARHMIERGGGGRIVNVSSRGAFRGEPVSPAYGASKAGVNALGQSLALALAPHGIAVATVAPGFVETDMASRVLDGPNGDAVRAQSPFGRGGAPGGGRRRDGRRSEHRLGRHPGRRVDDVVQHAPVAQPAPRPRARGRNRRPAPEGDLVGRLAGPVLYEPTSSRTTRWT